MSEIIHKSERGTVEVFVRDGVKLIRRTVNAEMPLYNTLKNSRCAYLPEIYGVEISGGKTVVTEEFIEGRSILETNPDEKRTVRAMVQLCSAMEHIHGLGIVHRDVKPSNILLARDGNIRLIDFEAARFVSSDKDRDTRCLGTDGFAPPEQYGFSQTDFRSDIYAAGQTMKTLLGSLSAKPRYAKIIRRATALDPDGRYRSAGEFAGALTGRRAKISVSAVFSVIAAALLFTAFMPNKTTEENVSAADYSTEKQSEEISDGLTYFGVPENLPEYSRDELIFFPEDENAKILFADSDELLNEHKKFYMYFDLDGDGLNEAAMAEADQNGNPAVHLVYGAAENGSYSGCGCLGSEYLYGMEFGVGVMLQITFFEHTDGRYLAVTAGDGASFNVTEIYTVRDGALTYAGSGWGETSAAMYASTLNEYFSDGRHNTYMLFDGALSVIDEYDRGEYRREKNGEYSVRDIFEQMAKKPGGY